ncbi:hypothetical protein VK792_04760 [Mesobacterium sp. TK19101]|uniref:Lipoprotein n=1 Tax=Mesobacterium hydrothermale TaxID=3111907 RepID=A0ABU6HHI8_9RHOB|nr:hypothetical protein [Mesobacterium sp. TK19101]MEC3860585.1 hypothetical protein [Mesobacterium sp. TK19101]
MKDVFLRERDVIGITSGFISKGLTAIGILTLSACLPQDRDPTPQPDPTERAACEAKGGTYGIGGLFGDYMCFLITPDGGQACARQGDCAGMCMAETRTCSTVTPMFGCHSFLDLDGSVVEMCID